MIAILWLTAVAPAQNIPVFDSNPLVQELPPSEGLLSRMLAMEAELERLRQQSVTLQPTPLELAVPEVVIQPDTQRFEGNFSEQNKLDVGTDFYSLPEFEGGLVIHGPDVAMKIGGYVKADFIHDFDPIDSTDLFDTTTIPVGASDRTNSRFHARQTRMSFDTRWVSGYEPVRIFVESDFFAEESHFRLRHAYGEIRSVLVGKTWTAFAHAAAAPATLDMEGSVSSINRRQAQLRYTQPIFCDDLTYSLSVEDTEFNVDPPMGVMGVARTPLPDFIGRVRIEQDWGQAQVAALYRIGGFQPEGMEVLTGTGWGLNFTGVGLVTPQTKAYTQVVFGDGIGSYRDLPDAAGGESLQVLGWMVGMTHQWSHGMSSNFTYAENILDNVAAQEADDVHRTTYLAINSIWSPLDRVDFGIEYLYGMREDVGGAIGVAHRVQASVIFRLP